jgi:hypothetical protein
MRRIAESGEHGDGIVRGVLPFMIGDKELRTIKRIKNLIHTYFKWGKIVNAFKWMKI